MQRCHSAAHPALGHVLAIERCSLSLAVQRGSVDLALPSVRRDVLDFMALFRGERTP